MPPAVQTELHSRQPDLVAKGQAHFGTPLDVYIDETWASLSGEEAQDEILFSEMRQQLGSVEDEKRKKFGFMQERIRQMDKPKSKA